jgi:hypothetical protein
VRAASRSHARLSAPYFVTMLINNAATTAAIRLTLAIV